MPTDCIRLEIPAQHPRLRIAAACIGELLGSLEGVTEPEATIYNVQLAVHECCANIVDHAYGGAGGVIRIEMQMLDGPRRFQVELHDSGRAFDLDSVSTPDLDGFQVHGYGIFLMREIMDEVAYTPAPGHNCWRLVKAL